MVVGAVAVVAGVICVTVGVFRFLFALCPLGALPSISILPGTALRDLMLATKLLTMNGLRDAWVLVWTHLLR